MLGASFAPRRGSAVVTLPIAELDHARARALASLGHARVELHADGVDVPHLIRTVRALRCHGIEVCIALRVPDEPDERRRLFALAADLDPDEVCFLAHGAGAWLRARAASAMVYTQNGRLFDALRAWWR